MNRQRLSPEQYFRRCSGLLLHKRLTHHAAIAIAIALALPLALNGLLSTGSAIDNPLDVTDHSLLATNVALAQIVNRLDEGLARLPKNRGRALLDVLRSRLKPP